MDTKTNHSGELAAAITKSASKQTYYTIRLFADRDRVADAYRAYGYFRWVDDVLDAEGGSRSEKLSFAKRQQSLLEACYQGCIPSGLCEKEWMLVDLVRNDAEKNSGLRSYLRNMMAVMLIDALRRGEIISQAELSRYTHLLSVAVTEALFYFIGHDDPTPPHEARYLAVNAAHITHMLRDGIEDLEAGYFNISQEYLDAREISPQEVDSQAYREWVCGRVKLARMYFRAGREATRQVRNFRCRLAGYAYTARFEWMLRAIERDNYCLRSEYPERKSLWAGIQIAWSTLTLLLSPLIDHEKPQILAIQPIRVKHYEN